MSKALAVILGAFLWLMLFWNVYQAAADAPDLSGSSDPATTIVPRADRVPPLPPVRVISILSGTTSRYSVVSHQGWLVLDLTLRVRPADYEMLPMFRGCRAGCRLRVYIVQERR